MLTWQRWLQVCLFADDRDLPGFLTKEEAEEERQQEEARLSLTDNRHMRFAESAKQEHISESLQHRDSTRDPRAPDTPAGVHLLLPIRPAPFWRAACAACMQPQGQGGRTAECLRCSAAGSPVENLF